MRIRESSYYASITKHYIANKPKGYDSVAWEAKITRTSCLNFKCLADHQEEKLLRAEVAYGEKIADVGNLQKPFDGWVVYNAYSVLIAIFYKEGNTTVFEIPIRAFLKDKYQSGNKSLTRKRAVEICSSILDITPNRSSHSKPLTSNNDDLNPNQLSQS